MAVGLLSGDALETATVVGELRLPRVGYDDEYRPLAGSYGGALRCGATMRAVGACVEIKSSTRLQCARNRTIWTRLFRCASRTQWEQSIRPKISRIDFDLIEIESSEVWWGPPKPAVDFLTAFDESNRPVQKSAEPTSI